MDELRVVSQLDDWEEVLLDYVEDPDNGRYMLGPVIWDQSSRRMLGQSRSKEWSIFHRFANDDDATRFLAHALTILELTFRVWQLMKLEDPHGGEGEMRYEKICLLRFYDDHIHDALAFYKP